MRLVADGDVVAVAALVDNADAVIYRRPGHSRRDRLATWRGIGRHQVIAGAARWYAGYCGTPNTEVGEDVLQALLGRLQRRLDRH